MRYFLEIAYNGSSYHGWQIQENANTVEAVLEDRLSKMLRQPVDLVASGRTDTGVHCRSQFAHFDLEKPLPIQDFLHKLNSFLPNDIAVLSLKEVKPDAHARFDAIRRTYEYLIITHKSPFWQGLAHQSKVDLDLEEMNYACKVLLGEHDFQAFCKTRVDVSHYLCEVMEAKWEKRGELLVFTIKANRFLRGMVRLVTGALLEVGDGNQAASFLTEILEKKEQGTKRFAVPAHGLYLKKVEYPNHVFLEN
ncbi:tRNA pseudouridine(38-40) synthase TruA [Flammeovirgaceae bacterium SG7u.132]|nr:tRNA pseudouridine(38-40) synthase TruA [Flammeovirgaceae bacterium SG7u.132]